MKSKKQNLCENCGKPFKPFSSFTKACSINCSLEYNLNHQQEVKRYLEDLEEREWKIAKKGLKEKLKTRSEYLLELQKIFNLFIRKRDEELPCISCGCDLTNKPTNASHFWSVGSSPGLRFNEDNVHRSCINCNMYRSGNIAEYAINLPIKIGHEAFFKLAQDRNKELKLTVPEIKELIKKYRNKIKNLQLNH